MCGRFTLTTPAEVVAEYFELADIPPIAPRYNIAPTQPVAVVRFDAETDKRNCDLLHWGLVPSWAKDPGIGSRMINARSETVAQKPAYRSAFKHRRCLVPADGFYEWQKQPGTKRKRPHYIRFSDGRPFAFAGLWEHWSSPDGSELESCTVLTTEANEVMKPLHDRMPVILAPEDYARWLDPSHDKADQLLPLVHARPNSELTANAVSTLVNSPSNDVAQCIEPAD